MERANQRRPRGVGSRLENEKLRGGGGRGWVGRCMLREKEGRKGRKKRNLSSSTFGGVDLYYDFEASSSVCNSSSPPTKTTSNPAFLPFISQVSLSTFFSSSREKLPSQRSLDRALPPNPKLTPLFLLLPRSISVSSLCPPPACPTTSSPSAA